MFLVFRNAYRYLRDITTSSYRFNWRKLTESYEYVVSCLSSSQITSSFFDKSRNDIKYKIKVKYKIFEEISKIHRISRSFSFRFDYILHLWFALLRYAPNLVQIILFLSKISLLISFSSFNFSFRSDPVNVRYSWNIYKIFLSSKINILIIFQNIPKYSQNVQRIFR